MMVTLFYWFHDEVHNPEGQATVGCLYKVWNDASPLPYLASRLDVKDGAMHSVATLQAGTLPGSCPGTADEATAGVSWMTEQVVSSSDLWRCTSDCGSFTCDPIEDVASGSSFCPFLFAIVAFVLS